MLDKNEQISVAKELVCLDNNIVSQQTYREVYGKRITISEAKTKINQILK